MKRLVAAACLAIIACAPEAPPKTPAESVAYAVTLTPADSRLAALYAQSCKTCHTTADSGAPLTGDSVAWRARWAKGQAALVASTVAGLGGMPAGGQCFSCTPDDYGALIRFMAGREA
jgi:cytochrome c5